MKLTLTALILLGVLCAAACGKSSSTPSTALSLSGTVSATGGSRIAGATIKILDGVNAGRTTTTNTTGEFTFTDLTEGNANVTATASIYDVVALGLYIDGIAKLDFVFPVPACQTNNTASVSFGNRASTTTMDIVWDGARIFGGVTPGQTVGPITAAAGVAHTLQFRSANTTRLACNASSPILTQCARDQVITCASN